MCSSAEGKIRLSFWRFSEKSVKVSYNKKLSQSFIKAKYCISSVERQRGGDKAPRVGKKKEKFRLCWSSFPPTNCSSDSVGIKFGEVCWAGSQEFICQSVSHRTRVLSCVIWYVLQIHDLFPPLRGIVSKL